MSPGLTVKEFGIIFKEFKFNFKIITTIYLNNFGKIYFRVVLLLQRRIC